MAGLYGGKRLRAGRLALRDKQREFVGDDAGSVDEESAVKGAYMDLVLNANMKSLEEKMKLDRKNWIRFEDVVKRNERR